MQNEPNKTTSVKPLICNKCGKSVEDASNPNDIFTASKINMFHPFKVKFNGMSPNDGMEGNCDICEDCMMQFINSFKIPLVLSEYDIFEDGNVEKN